MNANQEREHYVNAVLEILSKYDQEASCGAHPEQALANASKAFIAKFYPTTSTPQVEAFVRMSLLNVENMITIAGNDEERREMVRNAWGHIANCLVDAAMGEWERLNTYTLQ